MSQKLKQAPEDNLIAKSQQYGYIKYMSMFSIFLDVSH